MKPILHITIPRKIVQENHLYAKSIARSIKDKFSKDYNVTITDSEITILPEKGTIVNLTIDDNCNPETLKTILDSVADMHYSGGAVIDIPSKEHDPSN